MKTTILHIDVKDDIHSIRERIAWSNSQRILLVIPKRKRDLAQRMRLLMIKRAARAQGAQLGLVTKDGLLRDYARSLGINVFRSLSASEREYWIEEASPLQRGKPRGKESILAEKDGLPRKLEKKVLTRKTRGVLFVVIISLIILMFMILIPSATVRIYPEVVQQKVNLEIRASTLVELMNLNGFMPAEEEYFQLTGARSKQSSGIKKVGQEKAQGDVILNNLTSDPIELPAGVAFSTSGSNIQRFVTDQDHTIPADANGIAIPVIAVLPGEEGNVDPGDITTVEGITGAYLTVTNVEGMTGGISVSLPAPTEYDYTQLKDQIMDELSASIISLNGQGDTERSVPIVESLVMEEIIEEVRSKPVGEVSDTVTLELTARFKMLFYDPATLNDLVQQVLDLSIGDYHQAANDNIQVAQVGEVTINNADEAAWRIEATRLIVRNSPQREIIRAITGSTKKSAIATVNQEIPHYRSAEIDLFLDWWPYLPILANRIQFEEKVVDER